MRPPGFVDLGPIAEDDQIGMIGTAAAGGLTVGFFVATDAIADRYLAKLLARHAVRVIGRSAGPGGTILCRIGPRSESAKPEVAPARVNGDAPN